MPKKRAPSDELQRLSPDAGSAVGGVGDQLLVYGTARGLKIDVRYSGETLWMTQRQMADLFGIDVTGISRHIANIIETGELREEGNLQKTQISQTRPSTLYSLDFVISVGYRVNSKQATQFRIWATERLKELLLKGWSIDAERLKNPEGRDHFKELKEVIRDIRASEANVYREVRGICALCQDYDPQSDDWRRFYARMQNSLLWAVCQMTGPEIIKSRANAQSENMGLTNWPNDNIRKADVMIANNYLAEPEIRAKNRLTVMLLDYFEDQVDQRRLVTMTEAEAKLVEFIKFNERPILTHLGSVKRELAETHAEQQYRLFKEKLRAIRHSTP